MKAVVLLLIVLALFAVLSARDCKWHKGDQCDTVSGCSYGCYKGNCWKGCPGSHAEKMLTIFSAEMSNFRSDFPPSNLIDGNLNNFAHTKDDADLINGMWFRVHLAAGSHITGVKVWNRVGCCQDRIKGLSVFIKDGERYVTTCGTINDASASYMFKCTGTGDVVEISTNDKIGTQNLAEIQVLGDVTAVDGGWSAYGEWTKCSADCDGGKQTRTRECNNPAPANGGKECEGEDTEQQNCNTDPCPVDGGWSAYGEWTKCSADCDGGTQTRARACNNPAPANGGKECEGRDAEQQNCNTDPCPVDGGWSEYGEWTKCSADCDGGTQTRARKCNNPAPANGGKECEGEDTERQNCNIVACQAKPCKLLTKKDIKRSKRVTYTGKQATPGFADEGQSMKVKCKKRYKLVKNGGKFVCSAGKWLNIPSCKKKN